MRSALPVAAATLLAALAPARVAAQDSTSRRAVATTVDIAAGGPARTVGGRSELFAGSELESYVRYLQSLGDAPRYPWSIRAFAPSELDRLLPDSAGHPWTARYDLRGGRRLGFSADYVRPTATLRYNSAFPYGSNDGAVWAGRGLTSAVHAGIALRYAARFGELSLTVAPVAFRAENVGFALDLAQPTSGPGGFRDPQYGLNVDRPQRFGADPYTVIDPGQSTLRLESGPVAVGVSTANQAWGPAQRYNAVLGNNAAGFLHAFVGTAHPVDLRIARVHARAVWGRLEQSDYSPVTGPAAFQSFDQPGTRRFMAGLVATVEPAGLPGLELGLSRFYHSPWPEGGLSRRQFRKPFEALLKAEREPAGDFPGDPLSDFDNQLASLFGRWVIPGSGFELYTEYVREDHNYNLRDLVLEPDHASGYMVGVRKAYMRRDGRMLALRGEVINYELQPGARWRPEGLMYVHGILRQGHTNRGQSLGPDAALQSGAASELGVDFYTPRGSWNASWTRTLRRSRVSFNSQDLVVDPTVEDVGGRDVIHALGGGGRYFLGPIDLTAGLTAVLDLNRDFGRDVFNLNATIGVRRGFR